MALASGARLGVYEVVGLLGVGGVGDVYQARDPRLERQVAIKVLPEAERDWRLAKLWLLQAFKGDSVVRR